MRLIKGKHTAPEKDMARLLRKARIRYRRHCAKLPGTPDFVLNENRVVVFVDGDFWHGRHFATWRERLNDYWEKKISGNMARDRRNFAKLRRMGWSVVRAWETDLVKRPLACLHRIRFRSE